MAKVLLIFLFCLAVWLQTHGGHLRPQQTPPLKLSGDEQVMLYATSWCGYCAKTRRFFAENHIPYQELDVERTELGRKAYEALGAGGVPIIVVNETQVIRGFDPDAIIEALSSAR